jgi:RTA1 like protein.
MRIVFRLCEYSQGLDSKIPLHEAFQYCLDSLPMLLALVMLNFVHPGRVMPGTGSEVPSRKERKKMSIDTKARPLGDDMVCLVEC